MLHVLCFFFVTSMETWTSGENQETFSFTKSQAVSKEPQVWVFFLGVPAACRQTFCPPTCRNSWPAPCKTKVMSLFLPCLFFISFSQLCFRRDFHRTRKCLKDEIGRQHTAGAELNIWPRLITVGFSRLSLSFSQQDANRFIKALLALNGCLNRGQRRDLGVPQRRRREEAA